MRKYLHAIDPHWQAPAETELDGGQYGSGTAVVVDVVRVVVVVGIELLRVVASDVELCVVVGRVGTDRSGFTLQIYGFHFKHEPLYQLLSFVRMYAQ